MYNVLPLWEQEYIDVWMVKGLKLLAMSIS